MNEAIRYETADKVATITLNRPEKLNAFTPQMHHELVRALEEASRDKTVRAVIVTGAGRAFSAGQDLSAVVSDEAVDYGEILRSGYNPVITQMTELEKPVIAAVNGVAAGAGVAVALAADLVLASDKALFAQAFIQIGLVPDSGSTWLLPRQVGLKKAMELALLGDKLSAQQAQDIGLINRVVAHDELPDEALALARRLAMLPTKAIGMTKRALHRGLNSTLEAALEYEAQLQALAGGTYDHQEGVKAFLEKRNPEFRGE